MADRVNSSSNSGGIGFAGLLTIVFIILKLTGTIDWSWVWVLAPTWIPIAAAAALLIPIGIVGGIIALVNRRNR